jgi:ATP-dependent protease ClpP protease subunit
MKKPKAPSNRINAKCDISLKAKEKWVPLAAIAEENTINVFGEIGNDWWSDSDVTVERVASRLRAAGGQDVTVNINSFGGDMFQGMAIYNLLRDYSGKVTVKVLGIAASSASIIAMAGNEIKMSSASFLMIHNCWMLAAGNRHDFAGLADEMKPFDEAIAKIYMAQTDLDQATIATMMDNETWINGDDAIAKGFATSSFDGVVNAQVDKQVYALNKVEIALAKQGITPDDRRELLNQIKGMQAVVDGATSDTSELLASIQSLTSQYH